MHSKKYVVQIINNYLQNKTELDFNNPLFLNLKNDVFERNFVEDTLKTPNSALVDYFVKKGVFTQVNMSPPDVVSKILELPKSSVDNQSLRKIINNLYATPEERKDAFAMAVYQ